jgi:lysozyme family protein
MSAPSWPLVVAFTLAEEGGLTDDPGDSGGLTNFGISQAAFPDVDIRNLTRDGAEAIYRSEYWARVQGDDPRMLAGVDLMVFDMAVNAGVKTSAMMLQRCLGVEADGDIGEITLEAVACAVPARLIAALGAAQLAFYQSLPGWAKFGRGWGGRVARRQAEAMTMCNGSTQGAMT